MNMTAVSDHSLFSRVGGAYCAVTRQIDKLQPLLLLGIRLYVARVFFMSGLTKLHDWSVTVALFTDEYHVPVLPPAIAALMGTATEISMPLLLALGLATRFGAFVLFFFNIVAVVSYASLPDVAVKDHYLWGVLILVLFVFGPGKISLDHWLEERRSQRS
jgi:putative oxidoreductase